jgi:quercetin dioxygenase-like cupin family protein
MLVVKSGTTVPVNLHDVRFTPCSAPSLGGSELAMWTTDLQPDVPGAPHQVDREELVYVLAGTLHADLGGTVTELSTGDTLAVPAGVLFSLTAVGAPARLLACARAGLVATMADGTAVAPPWAQ